jgi:hypothetical protein
MLKNNNINIFFNKINIIIFYKMTTFQAYKSLEKKYLAKANKSWDNNYINFIVYNQDKFYGLLEFISGNNNILRRH